MSLMFKPRPRWWQLLKRWRYWRYGPELSPEYVAKWAAIERQVGETITIRKPGRSQ